MHVIRFVSNKFYPFLQTFYLKHFQCFDVHTRTWSCSECIRINVTNHFTINIHTWFNENEFFSTWNRNGRLFFGSHLILCYHWHFKFSSLRKVLLSESNVASAQFYSQEFIVMLKITVHSIVVFWIDWFARIHPDSIELLKIASDDEIKEAIKQFTI